MVLCFLQSRLSFDSKSKTELNEKLRIFLFVYFSVLFKNKSILLSLMMSWQYDHRKKIYIKWKIFFCFFFLYYIHLTSFIKKRSKQMNDVVFTEILFCDNIRRIELTKLYIRSRCGVHIKKRCLFSRQKVIFLFFLTMKFLAMLLYPSLLTVYTLYMRQGFILTKVLIIFRFFYENEPNDNTLDNLRSH